MKTCQINNTFIIIVYVRNERQLYILLSIPLPVVPKFITVIDEKNPKRSNDEGVALNVIYAENVRRIHAYHNAS